MSILPRFKQVILAVAIAIVLAFFVNYSLTVIYDEPKFENFCNTTYEPAKEKQTCESLGGKWYGPYETPKQDFRDSEFAGEDFPKTKPIPSEPRLSERECPGVCNFEVPKDSCQKANLSRCSLSDISFEADCQNRGGIFFPAKDCPTAKLYSGYCDTNYECNKDYKNTDDLYRRNVFITQMVIGLILIAVGIFLALPSVSGGIMFGAVITLFVALTGYWGDLNKWVRITVLAIILVILIWLGYKKIKE